MDKSKTVKSMIEAIYKPLGMTPLHALEKYRELNPKLKKSKITYAGRLDPMAEGVLLLIVDGTEEERRRVLSWGKGYEFEMILGIGTDTYDILGLVSKVKIIHNLENIIDQLMEIKDEFEGKIRQHYPPYSSKVVEGKPLWKWAREGRLKQIDLPTHEVFIERIQLLGMKTITGSDLLRSVETKLRKVDGDFRQNEITKKWQNKLGVYKKVKFPIVTISSTCSSGTYVRQLVYDLGNKIGLPAYTNAIKRNRVGLYKIDECLILDE